MEKGFINLVRRIGSLADTVKQQAERVEAGADVESSELTAIRLLGLLNRCEQVRLTAERLASLLEQNERNE